MAVSAVIVSAGNSTRMGFDKLKAIINGETVLANSISAFEKCDNITEIILVYGKNEDFVRAEGAKCKKPVLYVKGGQTRADSVVNGVQKASGNYVAIHDAARPFVTDEIIKNTLNYAVQFGAAAPAIPVVDTIKKAKIANDGKVVPQNCEIKKTPQRAKLYAVQTPQCFDKKLYLQALKKLSSKQLQSITDDCSLFELVGLPVYLTQGSIANKKITTIEDLPAQKKEIDMRIGHGYDVHKLVEERKLILGGVEIPFEKGLLGHSDADVLTHAVMDAVLGAMALGDIGKHFPDSDANYKGADSICLAGEVAKLMQKNGYALQNIDATILCEKPKLAPYITQMRQNLADVLGVELEQVSVKATTEEKLGFTGAGEGIATHAVALLCKI